VADAGVVRADPVDEQEDDLIEAKPDQKGQPGGNAGMPDMRPIDLAPPLGDNEGNEKRNASATASLRCSSLSVCLEISSGPILFLLSSLVSSSSTSSIASRTRTASVSSC